MTAAELNINEILKQRILLLDGAMGTMLQRNQFEEADFRGERFKDFPHPLTRVLFAFPSRYWPIS